MSTSFTGQLWNQIEPTYTAILRHPFIDELTKGTLPRECFAFYMKQDALYLQDFSRALAITGARSPHMPDAHAFLAFAQGAAAVESMLHESYFADFGITLDVEQTPSCLAYTQFLLATSSLGPYCEAVAALLPCFWIYREVGLHIVRQAAASTASNPYERWIQTYAGEDFSRSVDRAIEITERVGRSATPEERARMSQAFDRSARLEWMFWDSAYRIEAWAPV